jgi:uncharacterized protein (DUF2147 family)
MKFARFCLAAFFLTATFPFVQAQSPTSIVGTWFNAEKDGKIQIYQQAGKFFGKLIWLKNATRDGKPRLDDNNTDAAQRTRPLLGLVLLHDFEHDGGKVWSGGKIYDPKNGKTYSCKMTLAEPNRLDVRGYIGTPLLGRTTTWTRAE